MPPWEALGNAGFQTVVLHACGAVLQRCEQAPGTYIDLTSDSVSDIFMVRYDFDNNDCLSHLGQMVELLNTVLFRAILVCAVLSLHCSVGDVKIVLMTCRDLEICRQIKPDS
jgi:hypothetical protein